MLQGIEQPIVALARQAIVHFLTYGELLSPVDELPSAMLRNAGVFVSLKKQGELRGCIGTCLPLRQTLAHEVIHNAVSAATADPRFPPLTLSELEGLEISVDVLSQPQKVDSMEHLDPKRYGVIVRVGERAGVLLPDIPQITTVTQQLSIARRKAGIHPAELVETYRFEVERYH